MTIPADPTPRATSVDALLQAQIVSLIASTSDAVEFSETVSPRSLDTMLKDAAIPPKSTVDRLRAIVKNKQIPVGANSLTFRGQAHSIEACLCYWEEMHEAMTAQMGFRTALLWASYEVQEALRSELADNAVAHAAEMLMMQDWTSDIRINDVTKSLRELTSRFFSSAWFSDKDTDLCLYVLQDQLVVDSEHAVPGRHITLLRNAFTQAVTALYHRDAFDCDDQVPDFVRNIGLDIKNGRTIHLGGIFNVSGNHWVPLVVDVHTHTILYGDSRATFSPSVPTLLGSPLDSDKSAAPVLLPEPIRVMNGFLNHYCGTSFQVEALPVTSQPVDDTFSCGPLSFNALAHYFLPEQHPLIPYGSAFSKLARVCLFLEILSLNGNNHQSYVSQARSTLTPPTATVSARKRSHEDFRADQQPSHSAPSPVQRPRIIPPAKKQGTLTGHITRKPKPELASDNWTVARSRQNSLGSAAVRKRARVDDAAASQAHEASDCGHESDVQELDDGLEEDLEVEECTDDEDAVNLPGRPRDELLDELTVYVGTKRRRSKNKNTGKYGPWRKVKIFGCAGVAKDDKRCRRSWTGRTRGRVLKHAKDCLLLPVESKRKVACILADESPAAKVAAAQSGAKAEQSGLMKRKKGAISEKTARSYFVQQGSKDLQVHGDNALLRLFCAAGLPPNLLTYPEFAEYNAVLNVKYDTPAYNRFTEHLLPQQQAWVQKQQLDFVRTLFNVTISFDGGATRRRHSFYSIHATSADGRVFLLAMVDGRGVSHTAKWIAENLKRVINEVGAGACGAVVSDSTGNTKAARRDLCATPGYKALINLADSPHILHNMLKDIYKLPFFKDGIIALKKIISHFSHSNDATDKLEKQRAADGVGRGLESIGVTRFATITWSALSLLRCGNSISTLVSIGAINLGDYQSYFDPSHLESLQFRTLLMQLTGVTESSAHAVECLEAVNAHPADVFLYWVAMVACMHDALQSPRLGIPEEVKAQIRGIVNNRWNEAFEGDTQVHLAAFYLNPVFVRSDIFSCPNPLRIMPITLPGRRTTESEVPEGIKHPQTYLKVAAVINKVAAAEVTHGANPAFTKWKGKSQAFKQGMQAQFRAYSVGMFPFDTPLRDGQPVREWWEQIQHIKGANILAAVAIKLYSIVAHSMADERTMSVITWLNSAKRAKMEVSTIFAQAQIRQWNRYNPVQQPRRPLHSTVKFCDIERLLFSRTLDGQEGPISGEDSDEEENEAENRRAVKADNDAWLHEPPETEETSDTFAVEDSLPEVNLLSTELRAILSSQPSVRPDVKDDDALRGDETADGSAIEEDEDAFLVNWH